MAKDYETAIWAFYRYEPSLPAAILFAILFALTSLTHLYQLVRTRTLYFIPFVIGGFFEFIGYIGRAVSSTQTPNWTLPAYLVQTLLVLVAPALFAASIYMVLGRIILLVDGEKHAVIPKKWLTKVFVAGDVLSFMMQAAGGGIMASGGLDSVGKGEHIVVGGLFVQLLFFGFFLITALLFHYRLAKQSISHSRSTDVPWEKHLLALYVASALIMVRSIFRIVEYIQGNNGYLLRHEIFLYIFDAVLMLAVMLSFNVVHPSEIQALTRGGNVLMGGVKVHDAIWLAAVNEAVMAGRASILSFGSRRS